jgi:RHS repeat-associated protein
LTATTGAVTITYSYDSNGSLIMQVGGGDTSTFDWDLRGRMIGATVTKSGTTTVAEYRYTPAGIRSSVKETINGGQPTTTLHLIDTLGPSGYAQVVEERTESGVVVASYVYGPSLDPLSQWRQGQGTNLYLADGHSGVRQAVDLAGAVLLVQRFDAFGQTVATSGTLINAIGYRGERLDATLGQYYLRARFYDPGSGRFMAVDPYAGNTADPISLHRYLYAHSDGLNKSDPTGMWSLGVRVAGLAVFGALAGITINGINNHAVGRPVFEGWQTAAVTGAILAPLSVAFPWIGLVFAGVGVASSADTAYKVFSNPKSTNLQRGEALFLVGLSLFGSYGAGRNVQSNGLWVNASFFSRANSGSAALARVNSVITALEYIRFRVAAFRGVLDQLPNQRGRVTIGVGVAEDTAGARHTLIGSSEPNGYIRPGLQRLIQSDDIIVRGDGDAEANIVAFASQKGWRLLGVGATRGICDECAMSIAGAGGTAATPLRGQ